MELLFHASDITSCQRVASRSLALYGRQCPHHTWADEVNFGFMHMGAISLLIALLPVAIAPFDGSSDARWVQLFIFVFICFFQLPPRRPS
jgi:hypothetical protein